MNFGDILAEWERITAHSQGNKIKKTENRQNEPANQQKESEKQKNEPEQEKKPQPKPEQNEKNPQKARTSAQKAQKPPPPPPPQQVHPLTAWLNRHEVYDKDADGETDRLRPGELRRRLLRKRPDAVIDLHGLTQHEAWTALDAFFQDARRRGFEKVSVIHGKGNHSLGEGVLKQVVKQYLERSPVAGERGHGNAEDGGAGATWVLLKTPRPR